MTNVDLAYATATELLKLFRARKASPVELLKALIARSQKLNGKVNCLADCYFDEALTKAKQPNSSIRSAVSSHAPWKAFPCWSRMPNA